MKKVALPIFILILFFFNACSTDDGENSDLNTAEATELKNVSYAADAQQTYDIYLPKDRSLNTSVILLIHGGGWTSGDKNDMLGFYEFIKTEIPEVAIVNMNYRLADNGTSPYPMQIDDISTLVLLLKEKQVEY